ncbi:MAG: TetR/AcrR family transcriptional regulator [Mycobacterium sp.]|jgi:AcrR family transcriptional regulator|uniref:TetR/AcrR family transcriptional regulator n=1 Tax=Mycobacterium sp. TaxID=1785 RepID=UPI003899B6F1
MTEESSPVPKRAAVTDALLHIVAERGLDQVSVREVAAAANVSIGTVQHYFPTKDAMLTAAYDEVIARIRLRLQAVAFGTDTRRNLSALLAELLPLDEHRAVESRIHLAFAARAATMPQLARTQRTALADLHQAVTQAFATVWGDRASRATCSLAAHAAIAAADGLALHAISSRGWLSRRRQTATIEFALDALMAIHGTPKLGPDSVRENQR